LLVVDNAPVEFHPGVREERQLLDADHHFGAVTMFLEKTRGRRGSLQAQNLFEVESSRQVYCVTNLLGGDDLAGRNAERGVPHFIVNCRKISSKQGKFEAKKF
jgi:hypothetical protein